MNNDDFEKSGFRGELQAARELRKCIDSDDIYKARRLVEKLSQEERRRLTIPRKELGMMSAIFFAIERARTEFVKFLVNECNADYEEYEVPTLDAPKEYFAKFVGATEQCLLSPLEFALILGRTAIAEVLLRAGADATRLAKNFGTVTSPIRNLESLTILEGLLRHGADLNMPDDEGNTYLINAVESGNIKICRFLLEKGANVNQRNRDGDTAFTVSSSFTDVQYKLDCLKLLLEAGADPFAKNNKGEDALRVACLNGDKKIADFLTGTVFKSVERKIESYQILGTKFLQFNDGNTRPVILSSLGGHFVISSFSVDRGVSEALSAWKTAITLSLENQIQISPTKLTTAFGEIVEATSLSELEELRMNHDELFLQSMVLIHKHLGSTHDTFFKAVRSNANRFFLAGSYDSCWRQLNYCIRMTRNSALGPIRRYLQLNLTFEQIEQRTLEIIERGVRPSFSFGVLFEFMETIAQELVRFNEPEETNVFIKLISKTILLFDFSDYETHEKMKFQKLVRFVIKARPNSVKGRTILMEAVYPNAPFRHCFQDQYIIINRLPPSLHVVSMLLECGADVNERDEDGNNAAHHLVSNILQCNALDISRFRKVAAMLIDSGIHLDARNNNGLETTSCLQKLGMNVTPPINLMCLAARAIRKFNVPYKEMLPKCIIDFVEMH